MKFVALINFHSPETASDYVKGLTYTLRDGNVLLASLLPKWVDAGLVSLAGVNKPLNGARVHGLGRTARGIH